MDFRPVQLDDLVFGFSVTAKVVGLHIYNLKSYECQNYNLFFQLWGQGGASWTREMQDYELEQENSWQTVRRKGQKKSYAEAARLKVLT